MLDRATTEFPDIKLRNLARHAAKVRLLAVAVVCHLLLVLLYLGKTDLARLALALVIA